MISPNFGVMWSFSPYLPLILFYRLLVILGQNQRQKNEIVFLIAS